MRIGVTGATGFLGRYIVNRLLRAGHDCRCWHRPTSDLGGYDTRGARLTWIGGTLGDERTSRELVEGRDAVVHAALERPGDGFRGSEGDLVEFVERNVVGTIRLVEAARQAKVDRFIFISSCAVHDVILNDRPLDETHPTWASSHYGAHKAAIEAFVHSYGFGQQYNICALRPTGIYGVARPVRKSKWFDLIASVVRGEDVTCRRGGKEVHADDVARAVETLLTADGIAGQSYNCYDMYITDFDVASLAKQLSGSGSAILGEVPTPKNQIVTDKLRALGITFGGRSRLEQTVEEIVGSGRAGV